MMVRLELQPNRQVMLRKLIFFEVTALMLSSFQCLYAHDVPFPLPSDKINEYPFNMVGKVSSGKSSGSGTAISQKVVLSAAHVFFNEETLEWHPGPFKWNLRHSPTNRNFNMSARSYQYFSDYAEATRRFLPDDGGHSFEQFNTDVIVLIFFEDVAFGGYAGLAVDSITDNSDKMIVGYPNLNYSSSDPRRQTMHSTSLSGSPAKYIPANYIDRLDSTARRAYITYGLSAGPGNSGGPVYGLITFADETFDWGVVGITVGGTTGKRSIAVGIDDDVYDLVKAAESTDDSTSPDDHGDTRGTATTVELNRSIPGNLETEGDIDYFRFVINSAGTIAAFTTGDTDTLGTLQNNLGNVITINDDSGSGENFLITRVLKPRIYDIAVSNLSYKETGNYTFRVDFTTTIKLPDLSVDFVSVDRRSVVAGEAIRVNFQRSNTGDEDSGEFSHGLYLSADEIITTGDTQLVYFAKASVGAGVSEERHFYEAIIPENTISGIYHIGYVLDFDMQIQESDETNNSDYAEITVEESISGDDDGLPDLVVDFVGVDRRSVAAGEMIRVNYYRSNTGFEDSDEFSHGLYLSADEIITTDDTRLANFAKTSVSAGESGGLYSEVIIPENTIPGIYYLGYILDSDRQIDEFDEANNTDYAVIMVVGPISDDDDTFVLGGLGDIVGEDIQHPNGNVFDQILLTGPSIKLKAKPGQITRVSFMDENEDIVQVEFSGAGTFTLTLDPDTFLPAALPPRYNQQIEYVTGKPSVVIEGADSSTFFSIFTVGRINAVNQALFPVGQVYDAKADVKLVEVVNSTGFGGMQLSNAVFSGSKGKVGVDARGIPIAVRLTVGDIDVRGIAVAYLLFGEGSFTVPASNPGLRITGGDLKQTNGASIVVAESGSTIPGFEALIAQNNFKSDNTPQPTQSIDATFVNEDGAVIPVKVENLTIE